MAAYIKSCYNTVCSYNKFFISIRTYSLCASENLKKGLVLGVYTGDKVDELCLTPDAQEFDERHSGHLSDLLKIVGENLKKGGSRVFYDLSPRFGAVALVGLGKECLGCNELEELDERREAIRTAAAAGCRSLREVGMSNVSVEVLGDPEAAAEGSTLGLWTYQENKNKAKQKPTPHLLCYSDAYVDEWNAGVVKAEAQNLARKLSDTPSNLMTPTIFAKAAEEALGCYGVEVEAHGESWAKEKCMGAFLSVARGSTEAPVFLEMNYSAGPKDQKPIVLVGKGVTFDSGGISIKPAAAMDEMRADMGGAACVVAALQAVARLSLPINVIGLTPLCENMPSGMATKPGDVVTAMNGKTIQVDNTDAEGRLILADALCYAASFQPRWTLDIATLTGAMRIALGGGATGVFSNSSPLWEAIRQAGTVTGDRVWRFPLWQLYTKRVTDFPSVDVNNVGKGKGGGACTAAAFLKEFAPPGEWMHLDIAGVMGPADDLPYLSKGMTGRPTRTLIQLLLHYADQPRML